MADTEEIKKEYDELLKKLSDPELVSNLEKGDESKDSSSPFAGAQVFEKLLKRKNYLEKIITKDQELKEVKNKIEENKEILNAREDSELTSLAETEIDQFREKQKFLERELKNLLQASTHFQPEAAIIEIRAGTGGEEAALFAADLFRMYSKYGFSQSWKQKILDSHPTELGGFKEIIFELKNGGVFSKMKYEGGVHRVQRIPKTEKGGRIHTSTASVAVLAKPKKAEIKIKPEDLRIDFYRSSGPGGQYVNRRETAVRITHLPSGIVVTSQTERNQLQNKESAMVILGAKLLEKKEGQKLKELGEERKTQIGWAKRCEKIRTYNFPQDRITDHRIKKGWHGIEKIMAGNLELIISALSKSKI